TEGDELGIVEGDAQGRVLRLALEARAGRVVELPQQQLVQSGAHAVHARERLLVRRRTKAALAEPPAELGRRAEPFAAMLVVLRVQEQLDEPQGLGRSLGQVVAGRQPTWHR